MPIFATNYIQGTVFLSMNNLRREEKEFCEMLNSMKGVILDVCHLFAGHKSEEVEDLFQEITYNLWKSMHTFRHESDLATWVHQVAFRTARGQYRSHRDKAITCVPISDELCEKLAEEPADERVVMLYELIGCLDDDEKEIIYYYIDGIKQEEIALVTGKTENAVRQDIYRIKKKLKKLYENDKDK